MIEEEGLGWAGEVLPISKLFEKSGRGIHPHSTNTILFRYSRALILSVRYSRDSNTVSIMQHLSFPYGIEPAPILYT
jgi:hypothetical protein